MKIKQILCILQGFKKTFDFPVFSNGTIFPLDVDVQYLTFKICYVRFTD